MLRGIILVVRDVARSMAFYGPQGLGLPVLHAALPHAAALALSKSDENNNSKSTAKLTLLQAPSGSDSGSNSGSDSGSDSGSNSGGLRNDSDLLVVLKFEVDNLQDRLVAVLQQGQQEQQNRDQDQPQTQSTANYSIQMQGPMIHTTQGPAVCVQSPDGHLVALVQSNGDEAESIR